MILSLVSELLARVGRRPVLEEALETLRRHGGEVRLAGLTNPAKAIVAPLAFVRLGRPVILLVESNQHAEALLEPVRWFYRAVTGKPGHRVAHLPAHEVLPYENRSPHGEISEDRAVALWRFASGEADLLITPVQAALWRMREPEFYRQLARTIQRDQSIPHEEFLSFLVGAGYERQTTCEMPGQFAVRGGIIDVFSPETPQPIRVELLGDTIESIRAFDPNTQRSTNPMERATLLPLTEFVRHADVLERLRVPAALLRAAKMMRRLWDFSRLGIPRDSARRAQIGFVRSRWRSARDRGRALASFRRHGSISYATCRVVRRGGGSACGAALCVHF